MSKPGAFNKRAINITQSKDDPVLAVEAKSGTSNGQYNITVNKLATTSRQEASLTVRRRCFTQDGQLTFKAGDKEFTVDVKAGIPCKLSASASTMMATTSSSVPTSSIPPMVRRSLSSILGSLEMAGSGHLGQATELQDKFTSKLAETQQASSAEILVDGNELQERYQCLR